MPPDPRKWLLDMQWAADRILRFAAGRTSEEYAADEMLRCAVERNFEILGEALGRLLKLDPAFGTRIQQCRQIISFRNILIHGYDVVDNVVVWNVIQNDLPTLRQQVTGLLADPGERPA